MAWSPTSMRGLALPLALVVVLATFPGVAAAETRSGGTVVVAEGETVDGLEAYAGMVVVRGTVEGDLEAYAGDVLVRGTVTGDVRAAAGSVRIAGTVGGDVSVSGGSVFLERGAAVDGNFEAAAGNVVVAGTVGGNARLAGGTVTLADGATVRGNVEYAVGDEGTFTAEGATVEGTVTEREDLDVGGPAGIPRIPAGASIVYGLFVTLALGAVLLLVFPGFSRDVASRIADRPLYTGGIGLVVLVGGVVGLLLVAITVIGIPLALAGALALVLAAWIASVYGRFAVGAWLLSLIDRDHRWAALVLGVVVVAVLKRIPALGGLVEAVVALLGLGALALGLRAAYRTRRGATGEAAAPAD